MGLNLNDKKAVVAEVSAQVADAQTIAIAEYRGIEVGDLTVLRKKARESGVYLRVLKNTLVRRAVAGTPFAGLADHMVGPLIYSVSADPVAAAKVLSDFAKTNDKLVLKAGSYAGKVLDKAEIEACRVSGRTADLLVWPRWGVGWLDEDHVDRLLVAIHGEIQRLSEEFRHGARMRSQRSRQPTSRRSAPAWSRRARRRR